MMMIGTNPNVPNRILCKAPDVNRRQVLEKGVCSDSNRTAQPDGVVQKLGNDLWYDSKSIATTVQVCSQNGSK